MPLAEEGGWAASGEERRDPPTWVPPSPTQGSLRHMDGAAGLKGWALRGEGLEGGGGGGLLGGWAGRGCPPRAGWVSLAGGWGMKPRVGWGTVHRELVLLRGWVLREEGRGEDRGGAWGVGLLGGWADRECPPPVVWVGPKGEWGVDLGEGGMRVLRGLDLLREWALLEAWGVAGGGRGREAWGGRKGAWGEGRTGAGGVVLQEGVGGLRAWALRRWVLLAEWGVLEGLLETWGRLV